VKTLVIRKKILKLETQAFYYTFEDDAGHLSFVFPCHQKGTMLPGPISKCRVSHATALEVACRSCRNTCSASPRTCYTQVLLHHSNTYFNKQGCYGRAGGAAAVLNLRIAGFSTRLTPIPAFCDDLQTGDEPRRFTSCAVPACTGTCVMLEFQSSASSIWVASVVQYTQNSCLLPFTDRRGHCGV